MFARTFRPRFRMPVQLDADEVMSKMGKLLARPDCPCTGTVTPSHGQLELRVLEAESHFWSPALSVTVVESEDRPGSVVQGLVGPNPGTWTLFAMIYFGLWTKLAFAGIFGLVQWWLGQWPWGLYASAALVVAMVAMYVLSQVGQNLAAPETAVLRHFLEDVLNVPASERAITDDDPYHPRPAGDGDD